MPWAWVSSLTLPFARLSACPSGLCLTSVALLCLGAEQVRWERLRTLPAGSATATLTNTPTVLDQCECLLELCSLTSASLPLSAIYSTTRTSADASEDCSPYEPTRLMTGKGRGDVWMRRVDQCGTECVYHSLS